MTPSKCRAARALLGWTQAELERQAGICDTVISDYERGAAKGFSQLSLRCMEDALKRSGIVFVTEGVLLVVPSIQKG